MTRVLVIGAGSIGRRHLANAAARGEAAVCDVDSDLGRTAAAETGARAFTSLADALSWQPDGVVVATPHDSHVRVAAAVIEAGADVLIEKPIAHRLDDADTVLALAGRLGRKVWVVCNMRYHPGPATLRRHLGAIGRPLFLRADYGNYLPDMRPDADYRTLYCARRETGGGVILDGVHEIDYATWLFGPVEDVACEAGRIGDLDIDVEDYAAIAMRHVGGARSEIHLDYLRQVKRRGCEIAGTEGSLVWRSEGKQPERCTVRLFRTGDRDWETLFESEDFDGARPYRDLMSDFLAALAGDHAASLQTGREARAVLANALAALDGSSVCARPASASRSPGATDQTAPARRRSASQP